VEVLLLLHHRAHRVSFAGRPRRVAAFIEPMFCCCFSQPLRHPESSRNRLRSRGFARLRSGKEDTGTGLAGDLDGLAVVARKVFVHAEGRAPARRSSQLRSSVVSSTVVCSLLEPEADSVERIWRSER
jgi:hypothetical protein